MITLTEAVSDLYHHYRNTNLHKLVEDKVAIRVQISMSPPIKRQILPMYNTCRESSKLILVPAIIENANDYFYS